jgi:multimeric flavodoxin WrbA
VQLESVSARVAGARGTSTWQDERISGVSDVTNNGVDIRVVIAYHTGYGHTGKQAEAVARGVGSVTGTEATLLPVDALSDQLWQTLREADAIIFGAPTYMGGPSGVFKVFADASATVWARDEWQDKVAAGFTTSGHMHGDKLNTLIYFALFAAQHGMHWVSMGMKGGWDRSDASEHDLNRIGSWLGAMAQANKDQGPEIVPPASDLLTAEALGRRVASVTKQLKRGQLEQAPAAVPAASLAAV